jgi:glycosyltransferase involved in cell wall biosynthesis
MKLLFFVSDYKIGMSSILIDQIIAYNKIKDCSIIGVSGERSQEPDLADRAEKHNVRILKIQGLDDHRHFFRIKNHLADIIEKEKVDIIHVQNNWQLILIGMIKFQKFFPANFKILYSIHGFRNNHFLKSILARILIGILLLFLADRIICLSDYVRKKFRLLSYKMKKIYYGVDERFFEKNVNIIDNSKLKLIFPGQFRHGKNQELVISAFALYCAEQNDNKSELYLPGDGKFKQQCQKLAKVKQVSGQVIFPGVMDMMAIRNLYESCNIGIIPSNSETYGKIIVEPFVLGRSIITRKVGVAPEIIKEGINGYFFENESDLKEILTSISKDKRAIKNTGNCNFMNREMFRWDNSTRQYSSLINDLVKTN